MDYQDVNKWASNTLKPKKIAVCTAWGSPFCWTRPTYNMANLLRPEGVEILYLPGYGWCPARRHMQGVEEALRWGATHVCFLGPDQIHPRDILLKFTKHIENGWSVVSAMVPSRGWPATEIIKKPFQRIAYKWKKDKDENIRSNKFNTDSLELVKTEDGPYQEIAAIGSGALMFDVNILKSLKKPWFREDIRDDGSYQRNVVMDTTFTYRLSTEAHAKILCDLTIDIVHLDVFPIDESYAEKFPEYERNKLSQPLKMDQIENEGENG